MKLILVSTLLVSLTSVLHAEAADSQPTTPKIKETASDSVVVKTLSPEQRTIAAEAAAAKVLETPDQACEITKAAVLEVDVASVAAIVETIGTAVPEKLQLVAQCAIAQAPDANDAVMAVVDKLLKRVVPTNEEDAKSGMGAKDAKAAAAAADAEEPTEQAAIPNPLDFPGEGPVGPTKGGPGGMGLFPIITPTVPNVISPPNVTAVNPATVKLRNRN